MVREKKVRKPSMILIYGVYLLNAEEDERTAKSLGYQFSLYHDDDDDVWK